MIFSWGFFFTLWQMHTFLYTTLSPDTALRPQREPKNNSKKSLTVHLYVTSPPPCSVYVLLAAFNLAWVYLLHKHTNLNKCFDRSHISCWNGMQICASALSANDSLNLRLLNFLPASLDFLPNSVLANSQPHHMHRPHLFKLLMQCHGLRKALSAHSTLVLVKTPMTVYCHCDWQYRVRHPSHPDSMASFLSWTPGYEWP